MSDSQQLVEASVKLCCANFYGSELARFLLGDSFHPGGTKLTQELGQRLQLRPGSKVLDVAAGRGSSAVYLAECFGCEVTGIDLSEENIRLAREAARMRGLGESVHFEIADAEELPFPPASFDAIVCECAFCTFPNKAAAAAGFFRVLKPGCGVGISDLTRTAKPSPELAGLLAWIACIGDAQPLDRYAECLAAAGFSIATTVDRSECLREMVTQVRGKLLLTEVMIGLNKVTLPGFDIRQAKEFLAAASEALNRQELGYVLFTATKP